MGYDNFIAAFMDFRDTYSQWKDEVAGMEVFRQQMYNYYHDENWSTAFENVNNWMKSVQRVHEIIFDLDQSSYWNNHFMMSIYRAYKDNENGDGGEVTMDAILSVMVTATDSQLMNFIGLVDAYRQSLWNKDFNVDLFAALARGFE